MRIKPLIMAVGGTALAAAVALPSLSAFGGSFARPTAESVPADLRAAFAPLRRPAATGDQLSPQAVAAVDGSVASGHFGVNSALSRRVLAKADEVLYLVAGNEELCLVRIEDFGTQAGCSDASDAIAGNMVGGVEKTTTGWRVDGVLPDGVDRVTFIANNGNATAVPVANSVFSVNLDKITDVPAKITWTDPAGQPRQQILPSTDALPQ